MVNCDGYLIQFSYPKPNNTTVRIIFSSSQFIYFRCFAAIVLPRSLFHSVYLLLCARCQLGRNWLHIVP